MEKSRYTRAVIELLSLPNPELFSTTITVMLTKIASDENISVAEARKKYKAIAKTRSIMDEEED